MLLPLAGAVSPRTVRRYVAALRRRVTSKEALVATLPYSNAYFAKAYPVERLESLLDGIESAFLYWGGIVERVVPR